jgi:RNA polymerase sigma factor (sigma-70 family)
MATNQLRDVLHALRGATLPREEAGLTDGQLLENYVRGREEAAFAALVRRHGPMVWGVCRRVLVSHQDAEDAFQATFLVLVRKAATVVPREMVANFLHGVAHQTALKARATTARRSAREKQVTAMPEPAREPQRPDDLAPLLDQELRLLPDKYRAVIVLCDLEGKTRKEAAQHFRVPEGTVASRLATARALLARRLSRSGAAVSGAAVAAVLSQQAAASVPPAVTSATIKAASLFAAGEAAAPGALSGKAVALAEGVLRTMLITKLKIVTAVVVALAALGAGAALTQRAQADKPSGPPAPEKQPVAERPANRPAEEKKDAEPPPASVRGVVKAVSVEKNTITVIRSASETTFQVAPGAVITIDGKPGALAGLPPGANIILSQFVDATTPRSIQASGNTLWGPVVKAVDAAKNTVTVESKEGERAFAVAPDARIVVDGKVGPLSALPVGAHVNVGLLVDQQTVGGIDATGPGLGECGGSLLKAVDVEKRTITFDDRASPDVAGKTFVVGKNANIIIDGGPGSLEKLKPGVYVGVTLSVDRQTVGTVNANGPGAQCDCGGSLVKAVDLAKRTITIDETARAEVAGKTFPVATDALISIDGRPGKLEELPPGAFVSLRLRVDLQTVGTVNANGPRFDGAVKAVDAERNVVTIDDTAYPVAKDAIVVVDGKQAPLTALPTGVPVQVSLHVDRKTVGMIQTQAR